MQTVAATNAAPITPSTTKPVADPREGGGVQGFLGDVVRSAGAGYEAVSRQGGVQADKAAIYPFETVATATGLLKSKTANVKFVNKATSLLHTIGGFGMLILTANVSSSLKSPGATGADLANHIADAIDGRQSANGWNLGWGVRSGEDTQAAGSKPGAAVDQSAVGAALSSFGLK